MRADWTEAGTEIRNAIREEWDKRGWAWDTHAGQATLKLLPIVSEIMKRELADFKTMIDALSDNFNTAGMVSDRAKDAVMLYNALKRSGMDKDGLSYAVYAFLIGDKDAEFHPELKKENEE